MLQITQEGRRLIRAALALRTSPPVTLAAIKPRKRKATQAYRRKLIDQTAAILRRGEPTAFAFEAFLRHGLRAGLCVRGWSWSDADALATDVVGAALNEIGAKRPTYQQGQPEWTQDGMILVERERCVRCGWQLPEGHRKFCAARCADAYHSDLHRRFLAEQFEAVGYAP